MQRVFNYEIRGGGSVTIHPDKITSPEGFVFERQGNALKLKVGDSFSISAGGNMVNMSDGRYSFVQNGGSNNIQCVNSLMSYTDAHGNRVTTISGPNTPVIMFNGVRMKLVPDEDAGREEDQPAKKQKIQDPKTYELLIPFDPKASYFHLSGAVRVKVLPEMNPDLWQASTSGSSTLTASRVSVKNLQVESSGASAVSIQNIDASTSAGVTLSGTSTFCTEQGSMHNLRATLSGASSGVFRDVQSSCRADTSGASRATIYTELKAKDIRSHSSGASTIQYA